MPACAGSGKSWVKKAKKTTCPVCGSSIAKIGGNPRQPIPPHS
jgi:rRNA maturation endonuclease Nob1